MSSFISEGTAVIVPPYVLFRNPAYFYPNPDVFWPERWLETNGASRSPSPQPDAKVANADSPFTDSKGATYVHNTAAFYPFSHGPMNCAGKNLALAEMRTVVVGMMQRFDVRFAEGYDPERWEREMVDLFVLKPGVLPVVITPRKV